MYLTCFTFREVMVIVQNATSSQTPSEDIQTKDLKPYQANVKEPYVTAYLKADNIPLTFVIGDGKEYNFEKVKYSNQPLKQNSHYIVFLRFFESQVNIYLFVYVFCTYCVTISYDVIFYI